MVYISFADKKYIMSFLKRKIEVKEKNNFLKRTIQAINKEYLLFALKNTAIASFAVIFSGFLSYLLFEENIGIFTIVLTTLFLMPFIYKQSKYNYILFGRQNTISSSGLKMVEISSSTKSNLQISQVYQENSELIDTYLLFFIGVFVTIMLFILLAPNNLSGKIFSTVGWDSNLIPAKEFGFENTNKFSFFKEVALNNLSVLFVCFIFALIFPTAGILIVVWNAIVWGVIFSQYISAYSLIYNVPFQIVFLSVFWSAIPHIFLEAMAYFLSTISGIVLALSIKKDFNDPNRFLLVLKYSVVFLAFAILFMVIGTVYEIYVYDIFKNLFFNL